MSYQLVSAENEAYTRQIALKADEMIRRVMQNNPQLSLNMSTVLALINSLDEQSRIFQRLNALESQHGEADKQALELRNELQRIREQNWEMKKEMLRISSLVREYESLLAERTAMTAQPNTSIPADQHADTPNQNEPALSPVQPLPTDVETTIDAFVHNAPTNLEQPPAAERLKQTNLEDYLRENGWPQSSEA